MDPLPLLPSELSCAGLALRPERDGDRVFLLDLYAAERAEEVALAPWPPLEKVRFVADQFRAQHAHYRAAFPRGDFLIVERDGRVIGRLYLDRSGRDWRIAEIALVAGERGRGVGGTLIRWVQRQAEAVGAGVELHVAWDNPRAAALYARLAFGEVPGGAATHRRFRRPPGVS